jgi:hypothetical protein
MKKLIPSLLLALFSFDTVLSAADNTLSKSEKSDGWKLLFNGKNLNDWKIDKWNPESISVKGWCDQMPRQTFDGLLHR